jgi:hypothetical protein
VFKWKKDKGEEEDSGSVLREDFEGCSLSNLELAAGTKVKSPRRMLGL